MLPALPAILGNGVGGTVASPGAGPGRRWWPACNGTGGYCRTGGLSRVALIDVRPARLATRDAVALLATRPDGARPWRPGPDLARAGGDASLVEAAGGGRWARCCVQIARNAGARVVALCRGTRAKLVAGPGPGRRR